MRKKRVKHSAVYKLLEHCSKFVRPREQRESEKRYEERTVRFVQKDKESFEKTGI